MEKFMEKNSVFFYQYEKPSSCPSLVECARTIFKNSPKGALSLGTTCCNALRGDEFLNSIKFCSTATPAILLIGKFFGTAADAGISLSFMESYDNVKDNNWGCSCSIFIEHVVAEVDGTSATFVVGESYIVSATLFIKCVPATGEEINTLTVQYATGTGNGCGCNFTFFIVGTAFFFKR